MDVVEVDGLDVAYERVGSGPPLVLLHGYVGDGRSAWQPQLDDLSDAFTVVAWDAPGAGRSSDPPAGFGMAGYVRCLAGFIEHLGLVHPHLVGLSFGGALALALAGSRPDLPASLVLASAYAGWRGSLPLDQAEARLAQARRLSTLPVDDLVAALLPTMFSPGTPAANVAAMADAMARTHPLGFLAMAEASAEDQRHVLPHITCPTLVVHGTADERAPRAVAEALHEGIAGSQLVVLPDAGHVLNLEAPEAFDAHVRRFLEGVD